MIGAADEHVFGDHAAITLPHSWKPGHTRTYFKEGKWDTCSCDGLGLIVHEGFHVLQYQNIARGWVGIGALNASTILYLACYADHNFDYDKHRAEKAAYKVAGHDDSLYDECCAQIGSLPCDCGCNPASLNDAGLQDFKTNCSNVVQESNGLLDAVRELHARRLDQRSREMVLRGGLHERRHVGRALASLRDRPDPLGHLLGDLGVWFGIWFVLALIASLVVGILDWIVNIVGAVVGAAVGLVEGVWGVITSPFSEVEGNLWYTTLDATGWQVPDVEITKDERSRTKASPGIAGYQGQLYAAYKSRDDEDLWYQVFDGTNWLDEDIRITKDGKTRTSTSPSLAVYDGSLYMAYRASDGDDLWYTVFDGTDWLDSDIKITKDGKTRTSHSPTLAAYDGSLYMAYKSASDFDLWFNVFDGNDWLDEDVRITKDGKTRTSDAPALCEFDGNLYMAYKASDGDDLWYTVLTAPTGSTTTSRSRRTAARGRAPARISPSSTTSSISSTSRATEKTSGTTSSTARAGVTRTARSRRTRRSGPELGRRPQRSTDCSTSSTEERARRRAPRPGGDHAGYEERHRHCTRAE